MTARNGESFPRAARMRSRREFLSLGRAGERRRTSHFVLVLERSSTLARLGITVSRKVGNAVTRNRLKRRIRESFRRHPLRREMSGTLLVIAKSGVGAVPSRAAEQGLEVGLRAAAFCSLREMAELGPAIFGL